MISNEKNGGILDQLQVRGGAMRLPIQAIRSVNNILYNAFEKNLRIRRHYPLHTESHHRYPGKGIRRGCVASGFDFENGSHRLVRSKRQEESPHHNRYSHDERNQHTAEGS